MPFIQQLKAPALTTFLSTTKLRLYLIIESKHRHLNELKEGSAIQECRIYAKLYYPILARSLVTMEPIISLRELRREDTSESIRALSMIHSKRP